MRRRRTWALTVGLAFALLGCGPEASELSEGDEDIGEPGSGRFLIDGEALELQYRTIGGLRTFEGDIVLDGERELSASEPVPGLSEEELFAVSSSRLWPRGVIPYTIDRSVSTVSRVRTALRTWEATGLRFVPRTTQRAYVTITEEPGNSVCRAQVGYDGGHRYVRLRDTRRYSACNLGVVVHELGHTIGLWHEHTRPDRGEHVTIHWSHVPSAHRAAFEIMRTGARRIGRYDISSTMHYRSYTLTSDGGASITRDDGRLLLHDWATISAGDVAAIRALYFDGTPVPSTTTPRDAGPRDAGPRDAGPRDAGPRDAGPRDAGPRDSGPRDSGPPDTGPPDAPWGDAGPVGPSLVPVMPLGDASMGDASMGDADIEEIVEWEDEGGGDDLGPDRSLRSTCSAAPGRSSPIALWLVVAGLAARARRRAKSRRQPQSQVRPVIAAERR